MGEAGASAVERPGVAGLFCQGAAAGRRISVGGGAARASEEPRRRKRREGGGGGGRWHSMVRGAGGGSTCLGVTLGVAQGP